MSTSLTFDERVPCSVSVPAHPLRYNHTERGPVVYVPSWADRIAHVWTKCTASEILISWLPRGQGWDRHRVQVGDSRMGKIGTLSPGPDLPRHFIPLYAKHDDYLRFDPSNLWFSVAYGLPEHTRAEPVPACPSCGRPLAA